MADPFDELARILDVGPVTKPAHPTRPQRMNANSFCIGNRVFAMRVGDDLVLKLPPKRVTELIASGDAKPHAAGGKPTREWASFPPTSENSWPAHARESLEYVRAKR